MLTRRCTQRQFLLQPDDETNNAFVYCLAVAAQRYGIEVILPMAECNHHHTLYRDPLGNYPRFVEHFHKLVARCMNVHRGRWENFWASEEPCVTQLLDPETVIEKLVYAATNPVKDLLVERVHHWPGTNGYTALVNRRVIHARKPKFFFRPEGPLPDEITLELVIPAELGPAEEVIHKLRNRVREFEEQVLKERKATGRSIVGRRRILEQSWKSSPSSEEPRRNLRPRFAGRREARMEAIASFREFQAAYREARQRWLAKLETTFPVGTYWLARFAPTVVVEKSA